MTETLLTSTAFFPPISWCIQAVRCGQWRVEAQEHYQKGGFRNRCLIATANGPLYLSIPLEKGKHQSTPVRAVRMSQESNWRSAFQQSIQSAYGRSPFYEFYAPEIFALLASETLLFSETLLQREPKPASSLPDSQLLWDFNWQILQFLQQALQLPIDLSSTQTYQKESAEGVLDLRDKKATAPPPTLPYPQLFTDRFGFNPNVSILDLLFCMGPEANSYLRRCTAQ